jgi:DNA (cytosine-5)-methyltransferase 1
MKALDLFSGPGGLTIGMKSAGIQPVMGVEFAKDASETNKLQNPEMIHINDDIRNISFKPFKASIDFVYGGPPCQPFSTGGLRKGKDDYRDMIPEFIRVLIEVQPTTFLMENVQGLTLKDAKPYFDKTLSALTNLGYFVSWKVLNCADYGVPQNRKRLFVLGYKEKYLQFPVPTHGDGLIPYLKSVDLLSSPLGIRPNSPVKYAKNPDLRNSPYAGHLYNGGGRPIDPNGPCHTILASSGGHKTHWVDENGEAIDYHNHLIKGGKPREGVVEGARRLSYQECALIQTFPPAMEFIGSQNSKYTQIGDAVPPMMAEILGRNILLQINDNISEPLVKGTQFKEAHQLKFEYA